MIDCNIRLAEAKTFMKKESQRIFANGCSNLNIQSQFDNEETEEGKYGAENESF